MSQTVKGTVKWFSEPKGYGFVVDEAGADHHFNVSDVRGSTLPAKGDSVTFEPGRNRRGAKACNVTLLAQANHESDRPRHHDRDDRVVCSACSKRMIPRVITGPPLVKTYNWTPVPKRSICPFCGATYQTFPASAGEKIALMLFFAVFVTIALTILGRR